MLNLKQSIQSEVRKVNKEKEALVNRLKVDFDLKLCKVKENHQIRLEEKLNELHKSMDSEREEALRVQAKKHEKLVFCLKCFVLNLNSLVSLTETVIL